ncbi:MAG: OsmC family protein [Candidatus Bathyarchaeia archaeon]
MSENSIVTKLRLIDEYQFNVGFDVDYIPDLVVDETKPDGEGAGPNPPRLLAAAVGHCMSSSLIYCLKKARIQVLDIETTITTNLYRNELGRKRIKSIDIEITLKINDKDKPRLHRCLELFEDYCTVTQSIRKGIEVNVKVN